MKSNTLTIIKKEFARFFGDRQLLFTTVIMPGLLIYIIYSFMGMGMEKMATEGTNEQVTVCVENLPVSVAPLVDGLPSTTVSQQPVSQEDIDKLKAKDLNVVLVRFPEKFDEKVATYDPQSFEPAPNIEIYYNSANNASSRVYHMLEASLSSYEDQLSNRFDINRIESVEDQFDMASQDDVLGSILSKLIPMLILMMLFSGVMAIAPSSIAGEKERGTIATLLVTPLKRNELALGKVVSLSGIALLSGISSFIGIVLSLPKMIQAIVREVIEMTPKPDSIPFKPASMLVRLDPIDNAIGIVIRYNNPTFDGAAQINGRPARNSRKNFSFEDNARRSSTIPIIPTSKITTRTITSGNARMSCMYIPENIPMMNPKSIPNPPISATTGFQDLCISFPTISAASSFLIILGIVNLVTKKDSNPQIMAIAYNGS